MRIVIAILIFAFLIFFHELGHFLAAKKCNIKVNEFCIGFGPTIVGFTKGDTKYSIKLLPLGGACMMEGEDEESEHEDAFNNKPLWQRAIVVFAGPFFNFILAFVLSLIFIINAGVDKPIVTGVMDGYPAKEAGLQAGDEIVKLNSYPVDFYRDISIYTFTHPDDDLNVTYLRDGKRNTVKVSPKYDKESGRYYIGITNDLGMEKVGVLENVKYAFAEMKYQVYTVIQSLRMLVTRKLSVNDMSGPVGIVKVIGDTYQEAAKSGVYYVIMNMISLTVLLSANLGVMNLLPIPALDGGRLLLFIVEAIRRKKLDDEIEGKIHLVGFVLLMALMAFVMFNDIRKLF